MSKYNIKDSEIVSNSNGYAFSVGTGSFNYIGWYPSEDACMIEQKRYFDTVNSNSINKDRVLSLYKFVQFNPNE